MSRPLATLAAPVLLLVPSPAQGLLHQWPVPPGDNAVATAGDVDSDGVPDFAVGEPGGSATVKGRLHVYSGRDGMLSIRAEGTAERDGFGSSVAPLGDVDGDGHDDLAVGAPDSLDVVVPQKAYVRAISGADGSLLWHRDAPLSAELFGWSLDRIDDVDLDGVSDLVVGAIGLSLGEAFVLSGASGAVLVAVQGFPGATSLFGTSVAAVGDLDGDGLSDFGVGDPGFGSSVGRLSLHSGSDGSLIRILDSPAPPGGSPRFASFGRTCDALGDVDADGVPDLVVGAPLASFFGPFPRGRAWVLSGADGSIVTAFVPEPSAKLFSFGEHVAAFEDLDGDGLRDVLIAAGTYKLGGSNVTSAEARGYSSVTGELLYRAAGQSRQFAVVPDANGDGRLDYLLPNLFTSAGFVAGVALTGQQAPSPWWACPPKKTSSGCTPTLQFKGTPSLTLGADLTVQVSGVPPGVVGLFQHGPIGSLTPFGGGTLCVAPPLQRTPPTVATPSGGCGSPPVPSARYVHTFGKPELAAMGLAPGESFVLQAWFRDPGFAAPDDTGLSGALVFFVWP